jgi:hypothetical protein
MKRYVYGLQGQDGTMLYIGVGKGRRMYIHMRDARNGIIGNSNAAKGQFLIDCVKGGFQVKEVILAENLEIDDARALEMKLIKDIGRRDLGLGPLLNGDDGGAGVKNMAPSAREKLRQKVLARLADPELKRKLIEARTGIKQSAEHIEKRVARNKGQKRTPEQVARLSLSRLGKKHSAESRGKMAASHKGYKPTEETRKKQSASCRKFYQDAAVRAKWAEYAKRISPEVRARITALNTGRERTDAYRERMMGNQHWRNRKPYSPESLDKMREGSRRYWASRREGSGA